MEALKESKLVKYTLIGSVVFLLLLAVGLGGYVLYNRQTQKEEPTTTQQEQEVAREYPKETVVQENPDGSVTITPSKEDTVQIQDEQGNPVDIPNLTPLQ